LTCPDAGATPGAWVERWLRLALFHGQQANAWMKNIFEVVESSDGTQVSFSEIGPVELKGLSESARLHVARRPTS
jgi:hypothetical protein